MAVCWEIATSGGFRLPPIPASNLVVDRRRLPLGRGRDVRTRTLSPKGVEKSMNKLKRAGLLALQLLVALGTGGATVIMFLHPACVEYMLDGVAHGVAAGLLLAGVKVLVWVS